MDSWSFTFPHQPLVALVWWTFHCQCHGESVHCQWHTACITYLHFHWHILASHPPCQCSESPGLPVSSQLWIIMKIDVSHHHSHLSLKSPTIRVRLALTRRSHCYRLSMLGLSLPLQYFLLGLGWFIGQGDNHGMDCWLGIGPVTRRWACFFRPFASLILPLLSFSHDISFLSSNPTTGRGTKPRSSSRNKFRVFSLWAAITVIPLWCSKRNRTQSINALSRLWCLHTKLSRGAYLTAPSFIDWQSCLGLTCYA